MAKNGLTIIDRVVKEELGGTIELENNNWNIPLVKGFEKSITSLNDK